MPYIIKAIGFNQEIGYIRYPGSEYCVVSKELATRYKTKKEAEKIQNWYNKRGGIFTNMKVVKEK